MTVHPRAEVYVDDNAYWLTTRKHFSFDGYFDPARMGYGAVRVVNDDVIAPHDGFPNHAHQQVEIFSYVLEGELTHTDSLGNSESLPRGCMQYLSAGSGISHSEMNRGDAPARIIQVWVDPSVADATPQYGSRVYGAEDRAGVLLQIVGGTKEARHMPHVAMPTDLPRLNQDVNVYVSELGPGEELTVRIRANRQHYWLLLEGEAEVVPSGGAGGGGGGGGAVELVEGDGLEVRGSFYDATDVAVAAGGARGCHLMIIDVAQWAA